VRVTSNGYEITTSRSNGSGVERVYNLPMVDEEKWIKEWENEGLHRALDGDKKQKFYLLVEFPYPSGAGLHVGHARSWSAMDAYARKKRMEGYNVLYPMGWDAFGLPAENYALKMGVHPSQVVPENIATFKKQCQALGLSFDWSREIDTTNPQYYKWTQWIFIQLFKKGLAYQAEVSVNWCPACKTNLADEEVLANGTHERCGSPTQRRPQKQWLLKITAYADKLLEGLETVDYSEDVKMQQVNWIGRKEWIDITYPVVGTNEKIVVSTTRPDTNFGATFVVVAPGHPILQTVKDRKVLEYAQKAENKSELERISQGKKKTGVFTGLYAVNQLNGQKLPIWVADFVLMTVGTGAVVGVPGHDKRDFEFAKAFDLPIVKVVDGDKMINSGFLDGLEIQTAISKMMDYLERKGWGKRIIRYNLHDWVFSRQHYWGEPIPIVHCPKCGPVAVPEDQLPVELPYLKKYEPSGTGESPLAKAADWVKAACPECGGPARRETDTMPNWAGSNWYFIRYLDNKNERELASKEKMKHWLPVDMYQGGAEHITLHLLYSRFIYRFLHEIGVVPTAEPYMKRRTHGIVLGADGRKMSKSFGNVINPDEIVRKYGADTLRMYEMFMGPFGQMVAWSDTAVEGVYRFLKRVWVLALSAKHEARSTSEAKARIARLVAKIGADIEALKFNTMVAAAMEYINWWQSHPDEVGKDVVEKFILGLAPMAPFTAEELWHKLGHTDSVHKQKWPEYDPKLAVEKQRVIVVQVNGKVRDRVEDGVDIEQRAALSDKVKKFIGGAKYRTIYVPGKIINFVCLT